MVQNRPKGSKMSKCDLSWGVGKNFWTHQGCALVRECVQLRRCTPIGGLGCSMAPAGVANLPLWRCLLDPPWGRPTPKKGKKRPKCSWFGILEQSSEVKLKQKNPLKTPFFGLLTLFPNVKHPFGPTRPCRVSRPYFSMGHPLLGWGRGVRRPAWSGRRQKKRCQL